MVRLLAGCKNTDYVGMEYCEELKRDLPTFVLEEPSAEEWNAKALVANTKAFKDKFKRMPKSYDELMIWVYSHVPGEYVPEQYKSPSAANTEAFNGNI